MLQKVYNIGSKQQTCACSSTRCVSTIPARVGGWIGLAQGGSVISAVEIICFFSILTFAATREAVRERWWRRWQRRRSKLSRQVLDRRTKLGKKLKTFSPGKVTT